MGKRKELVMKRGETNIKEDEKRYWVWLSLIRELGAKRKYNLLK